MIKTILEVVLLITIVFITTSIAFDFRFSRKLKKEIKRNNEKLYQGRIDDGK